MSEHPWGFSSLSISYQILPDVNEHSGKNKYGIKRKVLKIIRI